MTDNRRFSRYTRISKNVTSSDRSAMILAHVGKTPKGKLRLRSVGIVVGKKPEDLVDQVPETDPRFVFETSYGVRKASHDIVRKSGKFSRFYDNIVKVVYEGS